MCLENLNTMKTNCYLAILTSLMIASAGCHTTERMLDQGRYDELLSLAQRKISGKALKKEKYVVLIEEAFAKITERDMDRIDRLKVSNRSNDWEEIVVIAVRVERRQEKLRSFLPLVADNGYQATFAFVKTHEIIHHAENQIVEKLYEEGLNFLYSGRAGDKVSAQTAYKKFQEVLDYRVGYRDALALRNEARQIGTIRVLLTVDNKARQFIPGYVANVLEESIPVKNAFWTQYFTSKQDDLSLDYVARLVVNAMELGPEMIREEEIKRHKKIQDGWDYVLDGRGNVAKDTAGNDLKIPRYLEVRAIVLKTYQEKIVLLRGHVELQDMLTGQILETQPVYVESKFYHQAQSFFGDDRALENGDRIHIGMVPFPSDESMMLDVAELVRPVFSNELEKSRYL